MFKLLHLFAWFNRSKKNPPKEGEKVRKKKTKVKKPKQEQSQCLLIRNSLFVNTKPHGLE